MVANVKVVHEETIFAEGHLLPSTAFVSVLTHASMLPSRRNDKHLPSLSFSALSRFEGL